MSSNLLTFRDVTLAPYAATSACSKGRRHAEPAPAYAVFGPEELLEHVRAALDAQ